MTTEEVGLIRALAEPLLKQGEPQVYIHDCCGWLVVGAVPQAVCRECRGKPESRVVRVEDLAAPEPSEI